MPNTMLSTDTAIATMPSVVGLPTFFASFIDSTPKTMPAGAQHSRPMTIPRTPQRVVLSLPAGAAAGGIGAVKVSSRFHVTLLRVQRERHDRGGCEIRGQAGSRLATS